MKKIIPYGLGLLIVLLSLTVIFGWHNHQSRLIQILLELVSMQYNTATAVGFLLFGFTILTTRRLRKKSCKLHEGYFACIAVAVVGIALFLIFWQILLAHQNSLLFIILIFGLFITALFVMMMRLWQASKKNNQLIAEHEKNVTLIYDATMIAANTDNSKKAMQVCLNLICEQIDWPVGHIYLVTHNDHGTFLESAGIWYCRKIEKIAVFKEISEKFKFTPGIGLSGRIWESKKPVWIENVYLDNNFPRAKQGRAIGVYGAVGFPIIVNGEVIAVFEFFSYESKPRNDALLQTFEIMSKQISRVFERKFLKQQLEYSAYHDFLTGVANRVQFEAFAKKSLARAMRYKKLIAVFMIDVDYFKKVNDTMGHKTGDLLLKAVAERLVKTIRKVDTLARLGGDEFALILEDIKSSADANTAAKKLIETMHKPFLIEDKTITISISIGIALFSDTSDTITTLMKNADSALYQAKRNGRDNFCQCEKTAGMSNEKLLVVDSVSISQKILSDAIEKKDFILFYQPKISFETAKLVGVEALIRWPLNAGAMLSSHSFVKLAEESGLIEPLSALVNHEAMRQCAEFQKMNLDLVMSINISAKLLMNLSLPDDLYTMVKQYDLKPEKICLEITEFVATGNPALIMDVLTRFRIQGFNVSIDDFGTGYSSLVELQRMPCCELKIDKSFIKDLEKGSTGYIIARSVINLGHDFGLSVVAEGVETQSAFEILKELKCDIAQGYYIGRPMPLEEFLMWLKTHVDEKMIFNFKKI